MPSGGDGIDLKNAATASWSASVRNDYAKNGTSADCSSPRNSRSFA